MSRLKKVIALICLVCLLSYSFSVPSRAIAGVDDLVIGGATLMTMGLLGSFGIMALSAAGVGDALVNAASQAGQSAKEFGQALFASYARSQNITAGQSVQLAAQGISYLEDGTIVFNKAVSDLMNGFVNWSWDAEGGKLLDYATPSYNYPDSVTVNGLTFYSYFPSSPVDYGGTIYYYDPLKPAYISTNANTHKQSSFYILVQGDLQYPCYIARYGSTSSSGPYRFVIYSYGDLSNGSVLAGTIVEGASISVVSNSNAYLSPPSSTGHDYGTFSMAGTSSWYSSPGFFGSGSLTLSGAGSVNKSDIYEDVINDTPVYDTNLDVFHGVNEIPDTNVGAYLDTGVLLKDLDAGTAAELANGGTIDIQDWVDAIVDLIATGEADISIDIADGQTIDVPLESVVDTDIPVEIDTPTEGVTEQEVANSTSVDGLDGYTLDLLDFFPFCIPFDIYDMLSMFSAQRQAPIVHWRFYVPGICDETIDLDFSIFDPAAQVLRSVELVAAAIGLAFVTKKLIQGGD